MRRLMREENVFLHGTRFDWVEFYEKGFRPLNERYSEWLRRRILSTHAKGNDGPRVPQDRMADIRLKLVPQAITPRSK